MHSLLQALVLVLVLLLKLVLVLVLVLVVALVLVLVVTLVLVLVLVLLVAAVMVTATRLLPVMALRLDVMVRVMPQMVMRRTVRRGWCVRRAVFVLLYTCGPHTWSLVGVPLPHAISCYGQRVSRHAATSC